VELVDSLKKLYVLSVESHCVIGLPEMTLCIYFKPTVMVIVFIILLI